MPVCVWDGWREGWGDKDVKEERWPESRGVRRQREVLSREIATKFKKNSNSTKLNSLFKYFIKPKTVWCKIKP